MKQECLFAKKRLAVGPIKQPKREGKLKRRENLVDQQKPPKTLTKY